MKTKRFIALMGITAVLLVGCSNSKEANDIAAETSIVENIAASDSQATDGLDATSSGNSVGSVTDQSADSSSLAATSAGGAVSINVSGGAQDLQPLQIVETGLYVNPVNPGDETAYVEYCGKITNPNDVAIVFPEFQVSIENADGTILATDTHVGAYIMPGDTVVLGSQVEVPAANITADTTAEYYVNASETAAPNTLNIPSSTDFVITNVSEQHSDWDTTVTGKITNNFLSTISCVRLSALFKQNGAIIGMASAYLDNLSAGSTKVFEINGHGDLPAHDTVEVYAQFWY